MRATDTSINAPPETSRCGHDRSGDVVGPPAPDGPLQGSEMTVRTDLSALEESLLGVLPKDVLIEMLREIMPVDLFHRSRLAPTTATILVVADQFLKVAPSLAPTATYSLPPFINTTGMDARVPGAVNESLTASVLPSKATTEFEYPWAPR